MVKITRMPARIFTIIRVLLLLSWLLLFACKKKKDAPPAQTNACGFNGWPTASTVGLPAGTSLQVVTTDMRTTQDGQVIEGLDMRARIYVRHKNVTIRNCILAGDIYYAVYVEDAGREGPVLIEHCDINSGINSGHNATFRNNHMFAAPGRFKNDGILIGANNVLIENNLIDKLKGDAGAHIDGIQILSGNNITIRNNWIEVADNPETGEDGGPNAAILVGVYLEPTSNVTVECNMLIMRDGWYPLRIVDVTGNIVVRHNRWRHGALNDIPAHIDNPDATSTTWEDNAFEDGIVIPKP
jgi:hypothetical protein